MPPFTISLLSPSQSSPLVCCRFLCTFVFLITMAQPPVCLLKENTSFAPFYGKNTFVLCTISFLWSRFMVSGDGGRIMYAQHSMSICDTTDFMVIFLLTAIQLLKQYAWLFFFLRSIIDFSQLSVRILSWKRAKMRSHRNVLSQW